MKHAMTGVHGMGPGDDQDVARLMGVITALAGEVYVLKAEVERLKLALSQAGAVDAADLEAAGASHEMRDFLRAEESVFAATVFRSFTHPDEAPDVTHFMNER
jgi:hypothetical protein